MANSIIDKIPPYQPVRYVDLGQQNGGIQGAWDALEVYHETVVGKFSYQGIHQFIAYKYSGSQYGMMIAQHYSEFNLELLNVIDGVKYVRTIASTS